jgi:hypothetical protein
MTQRHARLIVDGIFYGHAVLTSMALVSLPAVLIEPWLKGVILLGLGVTLASWFLLGGCALSDWERRIRARHGLPAKGEGPFVSQYFRHFFGVVFPVRYTKPFGYGYAGLLILALVFR